MAKKAKGSKKKAAKKVGFRGAYSYPAAHGEPPQAPENTKVKKMKTRP